jgi:hypothetical protein
MKYKLRKFLGDAGLRERMQSAAKARGVPDAAEQILRIGTASSTTEQVRPR